MKKRILSILLLCCMVLTLLPTTVSAADGPMNTIPKYDVSIDVYNRTSDISIKDSFRGNVRMALHAAAVLHKRHSVDNDIIADFNARIHDSHFSDKTAFANFRQRGDNS